MELVKKFRRLNELYAKQFLPGGLTEDEKAERKELLEEYEENSAAYHNAVIIQLDTLEEAFSYLPKVPSEPYEKEIAKKLLLAVEGFEKIANCYSVNSAISHAKKYLKQLRG